MYYCILPNYQIERITEPQRFNTIDFNNIIENDSISKTKLKTEKHNDLNIESLILFKTLCDNASSCKECPIGIARKEVEYVDRTVFSNELVFMKAHPEIISKILIDFKNTYMTENEENEMEELSQLPLT